MWGKHFGGINNFGGHRPWRTQYSYIIFIKNFHQKFSSIILNNQQFHLEFSFRNVIQYFHQAYRQAFSSNIFINLFHQVFSSSIFINLFHQAFSLVQ